MDDVVPFFDSMFGVLLPPPNILVSFASFLGLVFSPNPPKPPKVLFFSVSLLSLSLPPTPPPNPLLDDSAFTALFFPINTFLNAAGDSVSLKSIKYPKHFPLETSEISIALNMTAVNLADSFTSCFATLTIAFKRTLSAKRFILRSKGSLSKKTRRISCVLISFNTNINPSPILTQPSGASLPSLFPPSSLL